MSTTLIIGQAPARGDDPARPLSGRSGRVLAEAAGLPLMRFLRTFDRINLIYEWPGPKLVGKGDAWPAAQARERAEELIWGGAIDTYSHILLLGRNVARAFDFSMPWMVWHQGRNCLGDIGPMPICWAVIPHPSGLNRWWNSERNRAKAHVFLQDLVNNTRIDE